MTEKRFERVYGDIEVVCIDHQKTGDDKFIDDGDYDKFVDLLNELHDENEQLKEALIELKEIGDYQYARIKELSDENEQLEQTNQRLTIALKEIKEKTNIYLEMTKGEDQP
jgi:predicted nuclease with TOPRIM domain